MLSQETFDLKLIFFPFDRASAIDESSAWLDQTGRRFQQPFLNRSDCRYVVLGFRPFDFRLPRNDAEAGARRVEQHKIE
ncbi:hypothetical protein D3C85_1545530 [compost metagenome]